MKAVTVLGILSVSNAMACGCSTPVNLTDLDSADLNTKVVAVTHLPQSEFTIDEVGCSEMDIVSVMHGLK